MNIIVGISWPFANGDLHIGHAASSLPGDVIARFHRLKGNNVINDDSSSVCLYTI